MTKDQKIKELNKKIDLLHATFTTIMVEKQKEVYAKIIDYFSRLGHDMQLFKQEVLDDPARKSGSIMIKSGEAQKASASPRRSSATKKSSNKRIVNNQCQAELSEPVFIPDIIAAKSLKSTTKPVKIAKPKKAPIEKIIPNKPTVKKVASKKVPVRATSVKMAKQGIVKK